VNRHLSAATAAGELDDVAPAWDGDNGQWWAWYMSLAENEGTTTLLDVAPTDPGPLPDEAAVAAETGSSSSPTPRRARSRRARGTPW
jgi:hypothetical protein